MHVQPFYCCRAFITVFNSWVLGPFTSTPASSSHFQQQTHGRVYSHTLVGTFAPWCQKIQRRQWQPTPVLLPGKSPERRSLVGCSRWGHEELDTTERLYFRFSLSCIGEGNGNPLQCSCLENPRDGGAWWAAVCGVTQSLIKAT